MDPYQQQRPDGEEQAEKVRRDEICHPDPAILVLVKEEKDRIEDEL